MTAEEEKILHQFEARVRQLINKHKEVLAHNDELNQALNEEKSRALELEQRIATLEQQYANLKMAKMIEITTAENQAAQKRINKLIRFDSRLRCQTQATNYKSDY